MQFLIKYLLLYLEETYGLTSEKKIETAIGIAANENKYHPIGDFLNSLAWDGTERIRFCLRHFLGADVDDYTYEALKLFMLGEITRAFKLPESAADRSGCAPSRPMQGCSENPGWGGTYSHSKCGTDGSTK